MMLRKIGGVIAGFALWTVLWLSGNAGLRAAMPGAYEGDIPAGVGLLVLILAMSIVFSIVAGFVAAVTASRDVMKPGWVLALILLAVGIFFQSQSWDLLPVWYHLSFLAMLVPATVIGAKLRCGGGQAMMQSTPPAN